MKAIVLALAFLAGLPLAASAQVTKEDIKKLTAAGISDEVILSYVKANGGVGRLSWRMRSSSSANSFQSRSLQAPMTAKAACNVASEPGIVAGSRPPAKYRTT